jgi:hypothetical protein
MALENLRGRFNVAFGVGATGFSQGMVCAVPDIAWLGGRAVFREVTGDLVARG